MDAHDTNAGVWGDVTAGMRNRLDSAVPKGTDIVILQPGANDFRFFGTKEARTANISAMTKRRLKTAPTIPRGTRSDTPILDWLPLTTGKLGFI